MLVYVQALINIALRRLGPEDLPDSGFLLGLTLAAYLLLQVPLAWIAYGPTTEIVTTIAVVALLRVVFMWALLQLTGLQSRFRQALTALLGTSALLSLLSIPFSIWREATIAVQPSTALPSISILAIMLWSLVIDGHILARTLSKPFAVGLMVAVAYFFVHMRVLFELMPEPVVLPTD